MAAAVVLKEFRTNLRLITFEATCMATIPMDFLENKMFSEKHRSSKAQLFHDVTQFLYEFTKHEESNPELYTGLNSCDSVCMACLIDPSMIKETKSIYAVVEPYGNLHGGHMVSDWYNHFKRQANVEIISDIDRDKFLEIFRLCVKE